MTILKRLTTNGWTVKSKLTILIKKTNGHKALQSEVKRLLSSMKEALGFRAKGRKIICDDDTFELRETITPYGKANDLDSGNTFSWN